MSGRSDQEGALSFQQTKDRAAEWLWRQQSADWSDADQAELDGWLAQSRYHLVAYWRLKAAWERTERLAALKPGRVQRPNSAPPSRPWRAFRLAAVACAIAAVAVAGTYRWATHEDRFATAVGHRETISLADGSQIELNTNSAISIRMGMFGRGVELSRGEAFFKIHHDAARPFTVLAAGHRITDLGTEFSVRTSGDRLEVTLVEGRARLEAAGDGIQRHTTDLTPGEIAVATADTISVSKLPTRMIANALSWRKGKVVFSHVTLAEAAAEFNRYNATKLVVRPDAADLKVSGTFDAGSIGPFTAMAKLAFGLRIQQDHHNIVVSRGNANTAKRSD